MSCKNCKKIYYYLLNEYKGSTVLCSYNKYTEVEFDKMCKEAPMMGSGSYKWYESFVIEDYLKEKYDFFRLKIEQNFFVDADID